MSKNLIEIKKLKKEFKNNNSVVKVLNNVNINIESGKLVALVGPSGSGKSTFLHLLALLDEPTQGKIFLFGNSIANISEDKKNRIIKDYISIIFQNNNLLSDFTALENVAIPLIIRNQNYKNSIEKAKKVLAKVNLSHRLNHFPSDLSGGEQQRVAIARSLVADTKIILNFPAHGSGFSQLKSRVIEAMACGSLVLELENKSTSSLFEPGEDYVECSSIDDMVTKSAFYLNNLEEAERIALNGNKKYLEKYTGNHYWQSVFNNL